MDAKATSQVEQVEQVEQGGQVEVEAVAELAGQADVAALDATLREADWPVIQRLWRSGVSNESIYRLLRLRLQYRGQRAPRLRSPHGRLSAGRQGAVRALDGAAGALQRRALTAGAPRRAADARSLRALAGPAR